MERLNFQDSIFLRLESTEHPFHIAGLALFTLPRNAAPDYLRKLVGTLAQLPQVFPAFGKKLGQPDFVKNQAWIDADDYDPVYHVYHYAVPAPGRDEDLLRMVCRCHERMLDRSRPLWELHLIEGLAGNRFALYLKFHHALVDGVSAMQVLSTLLSRSPKTSISVPAEATQAEDEHRAGLLERLGNATGKLIHQGRAIPELSSMLGSLSRRSWFDGDAPLRAFTAPHSLFNHEVSNHRTIETLDLPLNRLVEIGAAFDATVNDVIVAICGGAIREYLSAQGELPKKSLFAGIPVVVAGREEGEWDKQLSTIICPLGTDLEDPVERIRRIVSVTRQSKEDLFQGKPGAGQDYMSLLLMPSLLSGLAGASARVPPSFNVILSNVQGWRQRRYLDGSRLDAMYPLSLVTDTQGLNIAVVSYMSKINIGIVACPDYLPGIEQLGARIKSAYRELGRSY